MKTVQVKTRCSVCGKIGTYTKVQGDIFVNDTLRNDGTTRRCYKCQQKPARDQIRALLDKGATVTLDGVPARIVGFMNQYLTVCHTGNGADYSDDAVLEVLTNNNGRFET